MFPPDRVSFENLTRSGAFAFFVYRIDIITLIFWIGGRRFNTPYFYGPFVYDILSRIDKNYKEIDVKYQR